MKKLVMALAASAAMAWAPAQAVSVVGFTGDFDPANWFSIVGQGGAAPSADASFLSISSPRPSGNGSDATIFAIVLNKAAKVSFSWSYTTSDQDGLPEYDPFGVYTTDGSLFTQISDDAGPAQQQGSFSVWVGTGEVFGFGAWALDGDFGTATTRVGNFRVDFVPEPASLLLMAAALAAAGAARRRPTRQR